MLVLKIVELEPAHGYGIAQRIQQISREVLQVQQGSLYPELHRLEKRGCGVKKGWSEEVEFLAQSQAATLAWLRTKVSQRCFGAGVCTGRCLRRYLPTVPGEIRIVSFRFNSLAMRSSPQVGFSAAIC